MIAFGLLIAIDGIDGSLVDIVLRDASRWPLVYLPSLFGLVLVTGMIWHAAHPAWLRRLRRRKVAA